MNLHQIIPTRKSGKEVLYSSAGKTDIALIDFWQWSVSDLLSNATRGRLAEFIVANALGIAGKVRNEWDPFDLQDHDGTKLEIKTSAYLQSWFQNKLSAIQFDIKPTREWDAGTNTYIGNARRQSDFYNFCLLHHQDKLTVDPLNLDQWTFYLLPTRILNEKMPLQKSISLTRLKKLESLPSSYHELRKTMERAKTDGL